MSKGSLCSLAKYYKDITFAGYKREDHVSCFLLFAFSTVLGKLRLHTN